MHVGVWVGRRVGGYAGGWFRSVVVIRLRSRRWRRYVCRAPCTFGSRVCCALLSVDVARGGCPVSVHGHHVSMWLCMCQGGLSSRGGARGRAMVCTRVGALVVFHAPVIGWQCRRERCLSLLARRCVQVLWLVWLGGHLGWRLVPYGKPRRWQPR